MKKILPLLVFLFVAVVSTAQTKFPQVQVRPQGNVLTAKHVANAPKTDDGKTIYCGVSNDLLFRAGGIASYNTNDPMNTLKLIDPNWGTTSSSLTWIGDGDFDCPTAGAYANGKYYAFIGKIYSFVTHRKYWGTLDLQTGKFNKIADAQPTPTFNNDAQYADFSPVYSMAYDHTNKVMYALYYDVATYTGGFLNCVLATVNLETGALTKVAELEHIFYNIAVDYTGNIYALTYKLENDDDPSTNIIGTYLFNLVDNSDGTVNENLITEVKSADGDSFAGGALQDMDFDHDSWKIRWNRISSAGTFVCELDPETGIYSNSQLIGSNATIVGIHTPFTPADDPKAPGHVTNLTATAGANGAKTVTLAWTNPTTTWDNHEVEAVTQVNIYRGDELIGIVTEGVEKGGQSSFTDTEASLGNNTYSVVPCRNEDEEGLPTSIVCYVGVDAPGAPQNVVLSTTDGVSADLSWEAPATGKNGGWYDQASLKYTITRLPDNVVVAKDLTDTNFNDSSLPTTKAYSYKVKASNAAGEGLEAVSNELPVGPAIVPPYSASFSSAENANLWTPYDANGDGDGWRYEAHPWYAWISTNYGNTGNDWLFSPEFQLEEGKSYSVSFCLHRTNHSSGGKEYARFAYGKGANVDAMTNELHEKVEIDNMEDRYYTYSLTAAESGKFNFGINALGGASNWGTYFTAFSITPISSMDLEATSVAGPTVVNATASNNYIVTVTNKGAVAASNYKVQLVDDDDEVLVQTVVTDELKAGDAAKVKVVWAPSAEMANSDVTVYGRVICDGDGNKENNDTEALDIKIEGVGNGVWVDYTGEDGWKDASGDNNIVPFGFSFKSTFSEVIYNRQELDLPNNEYRISKVSYDYNFGTTVEAIIKTYIGATDMTEFDDASCLIGKSDLSLVSDSTFDIRSGNGTLVINFTKPVKFNKDQNIVVAIDRAYYSYNDNDVFDNHFVTVEAPRNTTIWFAKDDYSFDWTGDEANVSPWIPVTHFFVEDLNTDAIREVVVGAFAYSINGGVINISNSADIKSACLYTAGGALVAEGRINGRGAKISTASLRPGTYVLSVNGKAMKVVLK